MSNRWPFAGALVAWLAIAWVSAAAKPSFAEESDYATWAYAGAPANAGAKPAAPGAAKPQRPYLDEGGTRAVSPAVPAPRPAAPPQAPPAAAAGAAAIPPEALAGSYGAATGPSTAAPNMIGDPFDGSIGGFGGMTFFSSGLGIDRASVGLAGGSRRFKIAEDDNPLPTDRVFFEYNHFQNPLVDIAGASHNLDRYTFGFERTFRDGLWSLELRVPFASGYNSTQSFFSGSLFATEFGDMGVALKRAFVRRENFVLAGGVGMVFPTGPDWKVVDSTGVLTAEVLNEAVHLAPFLGAAWAPGERLFFLCFAQVDFDTHGDTVFTNGGAPLHEVGVFNEQSLLFLDFSAGYWLYQNPRARWLTGIAPIVEIHYTTTLQNMDTVADLAGNAIGPPPGTSGRRDILNLTAGLHAQLGPRTTFRVAAVAPLTSGENREFDCEVLAQFDRWF